MNARFWPIFKYDDEKTRMSKYKQKNKVSFSSIRCSIDAFVCEHESRMNETSWFIVWVMFCGKYSRTLWSIHSNWTIELIGSMK